MTSHKYGWKPQIPDFRDHKLELTTPVNLPAKIDLAVAHSYPAPYDQGNLGSCTANAIGAALEADQLAQHYPSIWTPSRLYIYYFERAMEGTINQDAGAMIRDGIKVVSTKGAPKESTWPYDISKFAVEPPQSAITEGMQHEAIAYKAVNQDLNSLKTALYNGFPIVFGISVYESFESESVAKTGVVPMPSHTERCLGGHAILLVGYDVRYKSFKFRNSWGTGWGAGGYGFLPFEYVTNPQLASDFWTITRTK